ncbi:TraM recognition domain-containing protein [Achromobacter sp. DH1f]|uniref:TraM recognition domain-containing protein n=1 Tax=Achromobacter sp. DH1f TaxID=1397275 RepID=UPI000469AA7A|nr:TraM recognition domain-containing protein [Achromobacter sp. DH1f]
MSHQVETRHEIPIHRRVVDVRSASDKALEWLSVPTNYGLVLGGTVALILAAPAIAAPIFLAYLMLHGLVASIRKKLPYRYPTHVNGKPFFDPVTGKQGDGIALVGSVRSTSPYEDFEQAWVGDDGLRRHWAIFGSTGSGKTETLKGIMFNALCWGSGFFVADGKADNKLPTDGYTMCRAFGRDHSILYLNFLLAGRSPQQVARSRTRIGNGLAPFYDVDADTGTQMGINLLHKAEGDGKSWQEKAINVWRVLIVALFYKRDTQGMTISVSTLIDYLQLSRFEELYIEGYDEAQRNRGQWSYGFVGIKNYLDSGCPGYRVDRLLKKHGRGQPAPAAQPGVVQAGQRAGAAAAAKAPGASAEPAHEQENIAFEQHSYRINQLMPVLNLLDKTYSHIFSKTYPEIDMVDVALHNRVLFMLIPSLEKSSQEAENLGKLAIACLRVMMAKSLPAGLEGSYEKLRGAQATSAPYPFPAALDELGYYFSDGIAVMFAQARSLGISMYALAQDQEKLSEGSRAAEAGAMLGNTVNKIFQKIDDAKKTYELAAAFIGKAWVAVVGGFERGDVGWKKNRDLSVQQVDRVPFEEMNRMKEGEAVLISNGILRRIRTFYVGDWLKKLDNQTFYVNRFLQVHKPTRDNVRAIALPVPSAKDESEFDGGIRLLKILRGEETPRGEVTPVAMIEAMSQAASRIPQDVEGIERGVLLYQAACSALGLSDAFPRDWSAIAPETAAPPAAHETTAGAVVTQQTARSARFAANPELAADLAGPADLDPYAPPDPMSLIRKAGEAVLGPLGGFAAIAAADVPPPLGIDHEPPPGPSAFDRGAPSGASVWDMVPLDDEPSLSGEPVHSGAGDADAAFIADSLTQAHNMLLTPRSDDGSVVGIEQASMEGLVRVEEVLGNPEPELGAHTMQKIVAVATTPDTIARQRISVADVDDFFDRLEQQAAPAGQPGSQQLDKQVTD